MTRLYASLFVVCLAMLVVPVAVRTTIRSVRMGAAVTDHAARVAIDDVLEDGLNCDVALVDAVGAVCDDVTVAR
ncbi:MAG TPA: hypothetical protein VHG72_21805 [Polyangia bacterium]|nr:hypothetical protein [Polyangia bacterium]